MREVETSAEQSQQDNKLRIILRLAQPRGMSSEALGVASRRVENGRCVPMADGYPPADPSCGDKWHLFLSSFVARSI